MKRREFLTYTGTGILSSILLRRPEILYADDLITDSDEGKRILKKLSKIYRKVKDKGFPYEMSADVNGDDINDDFVFRLKKDSSVTVEKVATPGTRFTMEFTKLSGGWEGTKIYGIVSGGGEVSIAKRKWFGKNEKEAEKYLDAVLQYFEEEIK